MSLPRQWSAPKSARDQAGSSNGRPIRTIRSRPVDVPQHEASEAAAQWSTTIQLKSDGSTSESETTPEAEVESAPIDATIVDSSMALAPGQMSRDEFLSRLRAEVLAACEAELSPDWSAEGCPYIEAWFEQHQDSSAYLLEGLARRYTGLTTAATAADYIPAVVARLRVAVGRWRNGEDVTADLVDAKMIEDGGSEAAVQAKAIGNVPAGQVTARETISRLGPGQSPDAQTTARLGSALGTSIGDVRIHADANAGRLTEELGAAAFAVGRHVAFGPGRYQPGIPEGDALLAHEMAHVQQQRGGISANERRSGSAALEAEADRIALAATAHLHGDDRGALSQATASLKTGLTLTRCSKSDEEKKKDRIAELEKRKVKLDAIKAPGAKPAFGTLAAALGESLDVEHKLSVEKTGRGILTGNKSGEASSAGIQQSDCTILVLDVLQRAFAAQGRAPDWQKANAKALALAKAHGRGISGLDIQQALVSELNWKGIFWAPNPRFAYPDPADKSEHADAYRKVRESGNYKGLPVEESVVDYAPAKGSTTTKTTTQLEKLRRIPFGVLSARGATHMALIIRGVVYEVHWTETSDKPNVIQGTPLEEWNWLSGAIVVPPDDFTSVFGTAP